MLHFYIVMLNVFLLSMYWMLLCSVSYFYIFILSYTECSCTEYYILILLCWVWLPWGYNLYTVIVVTVAFTLLCWVLLYWALHLYIVTLSAVVLSVAFSYCYADWCAQCHILILLCWVSLPWGSNFYIVILSVFMPSIPFLLLCWVLHFYITMLGAVVLIVNF